MRARRHRKRCVDVVQSTHGNALVMTASLLAMTTSTRRPPRSRCGLRDDELVRLVANAVAPASVHLSLAPARAARVDKVALGHAAGDGVAALRAHGARKVGRAPLERRKHHRVDVVVLEQLAARAARVAQGRRWHRRRRSRPLAPLRRPRGRTRPHATLASRLAALAAVLSALRDGAALGCDQLGERPVERGADVDAVRHGQETECAHLERKSSCFRLSLRRASGPQRRRPQRRPPPQPP